MADNYEVLFTHPTGATATFVRQGGELDALAKGLDSEQFWVFKNVKALLARNDPGDRERARVLLAEGLSLYQSIGMPGFAQRTAARLAAL